MDSFFTTCDRVCAGQWACEVALWATEVTLSSAFVAMDRSELVIIKTDVFNQIVMRHGEVAQQVAKYAEVFTEYASIITPCRWRVPISNDFSPIQDLVHRVFDPD